MFRTMLAIAVAAAGVAAAVAQKQTWDRWSQCFWEGLAQSIRRIVSEIILLFSDVGMSRLIEFRLISVPMHAKKEHAA